MKNFLRLPAATGGRGVFFYCLIFSPEFAEACRNPSTGFALQTGEKCGTIKVTLNPSLFFARPGENPQAGDFLCDIKAGGFHTMRIKRFRRDVYLTV